MTEQPWYKEFFDNYQEELQACKRKDDIPPDIFRQQAVLYRHYDNDDNLLYVGCSSRPTSRLGQHWLGSAWFNQVAKTTYQRGFNNSDELFAAEIAAIQEEQPTYNVMGKL